MNVVDDGTALGWMVATLASSAVWIAWLAWRYHHGHDPAREMREWWKGGPPASDDRAVPFDEDPELRTRR
jgi:hypothetical protein